MFFINPIFEYNLEFIISSYYGKTIFKVGGR